MPDQEFRIEVLADFDADVSDLEALLDYNENVFDHANLVFPVEDEPFVEKWRRYATVARQIGAFACLQQKLVQLRFPIREGISQTEAYRQATRRGILPADGAEALTLEEPARLRIVIHPTAAGHIPLLITDHRADFEALVRALVRRNEPVPVPASMGACMVAGYNNWDRVRAYRQDWEARTGRDSEHEWAQEFRRLIPQKERYQDRFILLSDGPYSAVPAAALDLDEADWRHRSLIIRREHECAHYFTRRVLGSMRNNALDELIADYMGITAAAGRFRADWFLRFMGLEDFPAYRPGGRLENYRGTPPLSDSAFRVLQALVVEAAHTLERFSARHGQSFAQTREKAVTLTTLSRMTLETLAACSADALLAQAWSETQALFDRSTFLSYN